MLFRSAVVVFFVLSGFLVGGSVVTSLRKGHFSFTHYLVNRVSRLYVVLVPALLIGCALDGIGLRFFDTQRLYHMGWPHVLSTLLFSVDENLSWPILLANLCNLQTIATPALGSNGPLWSLANEFWYYLVFPLLLAPAMAWLAWRRRLLLLAVAFAISALLYPKILLYGVIWVLGAALRAVPRALLPWRRLSLLLAVGTLLTASRLSHMYFNETVIFATDCLVALALANLLLSWMHAKDDAVAPAVARVHAGLANFSYSLYLLHFPLLLLLCAMAQTWWGIGLSMAPGWAAYLLFAALVALLYLFAWAASLVTERHTQQVRQLLLRWCGVERT